MSGAFAALALLAVSVAPPTATAAAPTPAAPTPPAPAPAAPATQTAAQTTPPIVWRPCGPGFVYACGTVTVPLDRSGRVPGTVQLAVKRRRAPVGNPSDAVVALAGGPGQAALPLIGDFVQSIGSGLATRDLIVFDQRGTGQSGPLQCPAFARGAGRPQGRAGVVASCAAQLGARRIGYTTAESVADLEAIRQATGYDRLVLYGTSYGTKVALDYAREYPDHVESLLLDSVVTAGGPDVLGRSTFAAVPRVLSQLCASGACRGISSNLNRDLRRLLTRLRRGLLRGIAFDQHGHPHHVAIIEHEILDILVAGDLDPSLRAAFPAAVASALARDTAPLARLLVRESGSGGGEGIDAEDEVATLCQEEPFPWNRALGANARLGELSAVARELPGAAFAPFDVGTAVYESDAPDCAAWPYGPTSPAPTTAAGALPRVPTLILSGADDLRTPTSDARSVAAQIPGAQLAVIPHTGHSVLGSDLGNCSAAAVQDFFSTKPIVACRTPGLPALLRPQAIPPRRLGTLKPAAGNHGKPGQTLTAVDRTVLDADQQLLFALAAQSSPTALLTPPAVGGLRGGWAGFAVGGVTLHHFSYVPGVTVSGTIGVQSTLLQVGGPAAAGGVLHATLGGQLSGTLGGVHVKLKRSATGSIASATAQLRRHSRPGPLPE